MPDTEPRLEAVGPPPAPAPDPPAPDAGAWKTDKQGRLYVSAVARRGVVYRRGEETVAEALERDKRPRDAMPKARKAKPRGPNPDRPADVDLRAVEAALSQAFRSPALAAGMFGDAYLANHFTMQGPLLARNLVVASENNPWLRTQLEKMASGGDAAMTLITIIGLAGSFAAYIAPPVIYLLNLKVPDEARLLFEIPPRRESHNGPVAPPRPVAAAA